MSVTRATVRAAARQLIQDTTSGIAVGVQFLLNDPVDYNTAIAQALRMFDGDVPNARVAHLTLAAAGFRFPLAGVGALLPPQRPALPVLTQIGAAGSTPYSYRVAARNAAGQGLWSEAVQIATGFAALDVSHKNTINWAAVPGATGYDVFGRTALGELLMSSNQATTSFTDDGNETPSGVLGIAGLDAWVIDGSDLDTVWLPYYGGTSPTGLTQGQTPLDDNGWRVIAEPSSLILLELQDFAGSVGQVLRLEYSTPHVIDENSAAYTSITMKWIEAFQTLVAGLLLRMVANRFLQNTGSTGLPSDVVDRRSQSDQAASRAKEYLATYADLVGGGDKARGASSGFVDLDTTTSHNRGSLWHPSRIR